MNKKKFLIGLSLSLSLCTVTLLAEDINPESIMVKVDARDDGKSLEENMEMILIDENNKKRVRNLHSYSKDFGKDEYKIMFFKSPKELKNIGLLTYDYKDTNKDDGQWIYLTDLKKTKRIPSADKSSSFMGSDFSYYDTTKINIEDFKFKILKEIQVKGYDAWVIESIPKNEKVIEESGYQKSIFIIRKDNYVIIRAIHFMNNNVRKYMEVTELHKENNIWLIDSVSMSTKKDKYLLHKTIINYSDQQLNKSLSDNIFTTRRLEKGL